jgi:D-alanyl-D-alanine carboxypeptidase
LAAALNERIDAILGAEVASAAPGAAVAVIRDGAFLHRAAYGLADLEHAVPLRPDAVFRIASLTKQFTAAAVMRLVERGAIALDAPIETYLPDWPPRGRATTVRRLLNHTSGVWRHDTVGIDRTRRPNLPIAEIIHLIFERPFEFEPGAQYRYNNSGYLLLGAIVAAVTGQAYEDFLRQDLFEPLGVRQTLLLSHDEVVPNRAHGYVRGRRGFHNARPDAANFSYAAGGLGSTLDDLRLWDRAIRAGRVVAPDTRETMLAPTPLNDGSTFPYGFGWGLATYEGRRVYHHTGGVSGFATHMLHLRDEDLTVIVLANRYLFPCDQVMRGVVRAALGLEPVVAETVRVSAAALERCAGRYQGDGYERAFQVVKGGLGTVADGPAMLLPIGDGSFGEADDLEIEFRFAGLERGRFTRLAVASPLWPDETLTRIA